MAWLHKLANPLQVLRSQTICRGVRQLHMGSIVLTHMPKFHTQDYNLHAQQFAYIKEFFCIKGLVDAKAMTCVQNDSNPTCKSDL